MKKLKWIVGGLFAVVVAVGVAGFVVLSTMDFEDLRETIQDEARKATGRDFVLAGPIDIKPSLTPSVTIENVSFANADWGSRPEMVTLERFELEVALMPLFSGDLEVKRLILVGPDILLETDAEGRANWQLEALAAAAEGEAEEAAEAGGEGGMDIVPSFDRVVVRDGILTYRDGESGQEIEVAIAELTARSAGPSSPLEFDLEGAYNGESIKLSGTLGAFARLAAGPFPFDLTAEAGGASIAVEGAIAQPMAGQGIDLTVSASGQSLASLGGLAGTELPPLGPYEVSTRVGLEGESIALSELAATIGGSDISGQATLALGGERPTVSGAFTSRRLDLADFAPDGAAESGEAAPVADTGPYLFTDDPLPLDGLGAADADVTLTVGTLGLQDKMELRDLDLTLSLVNGRLKVAPLIAGFAKGRLEINVDLDGAKATPTLTLAVKGAGIDYGQLLKDLDVDETIQGTLDLDIDLRGSGGSLRAIASDLDGRTEIVSNEGVISNKLLKIVGVGLDDIMGPLFGEEEDAKLNCIVSRFEIDDGFATSTAMIFDSEVFTVTGGGTLDLKAEKLDFKVDTATREASIASLAVPFLIKGTLKEPSFVPDPLGTALAAAKTVSLFVAPPLALGALIAEKTVAGGEDNPCLAALEAVARGEAPAGEAPSVLEAVTEQPAKLLEGLGEGVEGVGEGLTKGLKGLFGGGD